MKTRKQASVAAAQAPREPGPSVAGPSNSARQAALGLASPKEPRGGMTYTAQAGETLADIATAVYGDPAYALDIELENFAACEGEERVFQGGEVLNLPVLEVPALDVREAPAARSPAPAAAPPEPASTQVRNHITDGPYGWDSAYEVSFTGRECKLDMKLKVVPQPDVSAEEAERIKTETATAFASIYDRRFTLTDTATHEAFTLRVGITYVDSGEHLLINLYSGNRRNNLSTWSTERPVSTRAHELGHQLGLKDEYVDPSAPDRATGTSPGVHTDHSIMGNYHSEGYAEAEAKQRHGEVIGGHIGAACGRTFSITTNARR